MIEEMGSIKQYTDLYDSARDAIFASTGEPMNAMRDAAREGMDGESLPTKPVSYTHLTLPTIA